jgi:hypothetical protein
MAETLMCASECVDSPYSPSANNNCLNEGDTT